MNRVQIISAKYERGLGRADFSLDTLAEFPEIAVIGRSNVGKSSFINRLASRKNLAKVSSQPGHTKTFNSYIFTLRNNERSHAFRLVDLPGFGYAKFSKERRTELSRDIVTYVRERKALLMVLLLIDVRRDPGEDEFAIQKLCFESEREFQVVLTKSDKLSKAQCLERKSTIARSLGLEREDLLLTQLKSTNDDILQRVYPVISST